MLVNVSIIFFFCYETCIKFESLRNWIKTKQWPHIFLSHVIPWAILYQLYNLKNVKTGYFKTWLLFRTIDTWSSPKKNQILTLRYMCQNVRCHVVALTEVERLRIVTHCYAASFLRKQHFLQPRVLSLTQR